MSCNINKIAISNWTYLNYDGERFSCTVPASMYSILLKEERLKDPFFRIHEKDATPLSFNDVSFEASFTADPELLSHKHILLRFEGLDTLCDIYLNGRKLAFTENMHRTYEFDIKDRLKEGENLIKLYFHSPLKAMQKAQNEYRLTTDLFCFDGAAHIRKAFYMMGWDWGPCLPDMGIWKPVYIVTFDEARLSDVCTHQIHKNGTVTLNIESEFEGAPDGISVHYFLTSPDGKTTLAAIANEDGFASISVDDPELWWPNGYGAQPLYTLKTELMYNGEVIDCRSMRLGLRTLTVSTAKDQWGSEFCFVINGKKIFSMGANYVPEDNILSRLCPERTEKLLRKCIKANFNTVRVWGGGFYPFDWFYDICDELGLIVWQDFMFACMNVRMLPSFEENIRAEFYDNLKRIRHHACIGLLCGNNEMELFVGGSETYGASHSARADYLYLYERMLPDICKKLAPDIFYWQSSPSSIGGFVKPNDPNMGDAHYWDVWNGRAPMTEYRNKYFRFCSEFGFESMPNKETVESFTLSHDRNLFSPVMNHHQKRAGANGTIMHYLSEYYLYPESFDAVLYASQIMQAEAIRYAVEHFRSIRGRCMGTTYWQLNDCWPVISWSSVDGGGREKALHHAARRFYAPVLLSARDEGTRATFNISNETINDFNGKVKITLSTREFEVIDETEYTVYIPALTAQNIVSLDFSDKVKGIENKTFVRYTLIDEGGDIISCGTVLFVRPKHFEFKKPSIKYRLEGNGDKKILRISADSLVSALRIDFSDPTVEADTQFLDINSADEITVEINSPHITADELKEQISFFSVADIAPSAIPE